MKIAVAGAGMAGSYLFRLLKDEGFDQIDLYGAKERTSCGYRPCAWGFAPSSECRRLISRFADIDSHVLRHVDTMEIDGSRVEADMLTIDKPSLLNELLGDSEIRYEVLSPSSYDRVIDATGLQRAYLGKADGEEFIVDLKQYRVRTEQEIGAWIRSSSIGYEYCFPLREGEYHIGFGSIHSGVEGYEPRVGPGDHKVLCRCSSRLRLSSPFYSQPFFNGNVVGVGESIGTVAPLGGDGNQYSMQCAEMLLENWDDLEAYRSAILAEFDWMRRERLVLEKLRQGRRPSILDARVFVNHAHRLGFGITPRLALSVFAKSWKN